MAERTWLLAGLLLGLHLLLGWTSAERASLTIDEHAHLAAGVVYVQARDPRLNPEHPPLAKVLCALPAGPARLDREDPAWVRTGTWLLAAQAGALTPEVGAAVRAEWTFARHFLYGHNRDQLASWVRRGRLVTLLLSLALGVVVWRFTAEAWGPRAGLAALAVWALSPTALAHGRLITTDTCTALFMTCALWAGVRLFQAERLVGPTLALGAALGGALATKHSTLFLLGFLPLALGGWAATLAPEARGSWLRHRAAALVAASALGVALALTLELVLFKTSVWLTGLELVVRQLTHQGEYRAFLLGGADRERYLHYFPVVFLLKSTLGLVGLTLTGLALAARRRAWRGPLPRTLLLYGSAYALVVVWRFPNVGVRYLLPLYPLLAIGAGGLWARSGPRLRRGVVALIALHVVSGALAWPRYLPYMNLVSATRGKAFFLDDSNLDWGQGLKALGRWCADERVEQLALLPATPIASPTFYGVPAVVIRPGDVARLAPGAPLAVSVFHLQRNAPLRARLARCRVRAVVAEVYVVYEVAP